MIINKNSWHYRIFKFTYFGFSVPRWVSFCKYWRHVFLLAPILAMAILAFGSILIPLAIVATIIAYLIITPLKWALGEVPTEGFFGEYLAMWRNLFSTGRKDLFTFRPYQPFQIGMWKFFPLALLKWVWWFSLTCSIGYSIWYISIHSFDLLFAGHNDRSFILGTVILLTCLVLWVRAKPRQLCKVKEALQLTKEFVKAKKQQICPVIEFVD